MNAKLLLSGIGLFAAGLMGWRYVCRKARMWISAERGRE